MSDDNEEMRFAKSCHNRSFSFRLPLTTSTAHNAKQNNQFTSESLVHKGYYLRRYPPVVNESSMKEKMIPAEETVADKTVIDCKYS